MEESKAYIETGILELYVLGQLTPAEAAEVEAMAAKYPEVRLELTEIETALEHYAHAHAVLPEPALGQQVFDTLFPPLQPAPDVTETPAIVPLHPAGTGAAVRSLRYALAACAALLIVSLAALYHAYGQLDHAREQIAALHTDNQKFVATVSYYRTENKDLQLIAAMPSNPEWASVKLSGTKLSPKATMMVYWHKGQAEVMVDNTRMSLPENDPAHQYQLWAMVKGKPVDLGVFDAKARPQRLLVAMKDIHSPQAFAVTLEKRGGSSSPTMEKMVALGGVSI